MISSTILKPVIDENSTNFTDISFCGIHDCPGSTEAKIKKPLLSTVYILCGIYVGTALCSALLILVFLNTYKQIGMSPSKKQFPSPYHLLVNTLKHAKNKNQLLIIPLTLWSGFEQAYIGADFTKSYISCVKGINQVGLVMICFGVADTLGSYLFGYAIKYVGRVPCFYVAAGLNYLSLMLMIFWKPSVESSYLLYIIAVLWGLSDAV